MKATNGPAEREEWSLAHLFPNQVAEARSVTGLILLPIAPIEWHGPHLAMGCDGLLAHAFARRLAYELKSPYYPPLYVGTERERRPEVLRSIGFSGEEYVEGMDFPANTVKSGYFREEAFALILRSTLDVLFGRMGFRSVAIVNGHGAENQKAVLDRLCAEFNADGHTRLLWVYPGFSKSLVAGSIGHATAEEASLLAASWPSCVDVTRLPQEGPLRNIAHAIVDGDSFDGNPTPDHTVRKDRDPRFHTDPAAGERYMEEAVRETVALIRNGMLGMDGTLRDPSHPVGTRGTKA